MEDSNSETELQLERLKEELATLMPTLGKHRIREIRQVIDKHLATRFQMGNKRLKYGELNKGFDEKQLEAFFHAIDSEKYKLLFAYMAYLGLRIGEVVKVRLSDIDFQTREIRVRSEKTHVLDLLIIPFHLFQQTQEFMAKYRVEIDKGDSYLFFKEGRSTRSEAWLESNFVRKKFRDYIERAGFNEVYDVSEETQDWRKSRKLHILTTHSLRHYAITKFAQSCNGNILLTSKFARHLAPNTTLGYIHTDKKELFEQIDKAFAN